MSLRTATHFYIICRDVIFAISLPCVDGLLTHSAFAFCWHCDILFTIL